MHSHEKYKALYEKLAESSHEESDMEPSDADSDDGQPDGQVSVWGFESQSILKENWVRTNNGCRDQKKL